MKNLTFTPRMLPKAKRFPVREEARPRLYGRLTLANGRREYQDADA